MMVRVDDIYEWTRPLFFLLLSHHPRGSTTHESPDDDENDDENDDDDDDDGCDDGGDGNGDGDSKYSMTDLQGQHNPSTHDPEEQPFHRQHAVETPPKK